MNLVPITPSGTAAHAAEAAAAAGPGAATVSPARTTALGTLLGSHVLRDGELVLFILKPSLWFIVFNSLAFALATAALAILAMFIDRHTRDQFYFETALFFIAG